MMLRAWPELFEGLGVQSVDSYGPRLRQALAESFPRIGQRPAYRAADAGHL